MKNGSNESPKVQLVIASIVSNSFPASRIALSGGFQDQIELIFEDETVIELDDFGFFAIYDYEKKPWTQYENSTFLDVANEILQNLANADYQVYAAVLDPKGEIAPDPKQLVSHNPLADIQCENCGKIGGIKKIIYGMPSSNFNFDKYIVGGCCPPDSPDWIGCKYCKWEANMNEIREKT